MPISVKALSKILLACILLGAAVSPPRLAIAADSRVALIIGNGAYPTARLRNPVNDATAMAAKLRALGFDVILRTETTRRDMERAISEFGGKLAAGNIALFYYAGHAMQVKGKNFLIPVDAEIDNEDMVRTEGIDVDRLFERLKLARLNVVILDACRDNPFERFRGGSGGSGGLAEIDAPIGTFLAYATSPGKVAADGAGANGLYTTELLNAIDVPGLKIEDVFKQVRINVLKVSDNTQVPWESSSMTGEFYFRPDAKAAAVDAQLRRADQERLELQREMEKLRAEITRLVGTALASKVNTPATQTALATTTSLSTAGSAQSPAHTAPAPSTVATGSIPSAAGIPAQKIMAASAAPTPPASPTTIRETWEKRITLLNGLRGKLSYSSAIAILFDIKNDDDLTNIVRFERFLKISSWASALAMGVDENGRTLWANASRYRSPSFAQDSALEFCAREAAIKVEDSSAEGSIAAVEKPAIQCQLIIINSDLQEKALLEVAERLKQSDPAATRDAYLESITVARAENFTPGGQGAMGNNLPGSSQSARVFTPTRKEP